MAFSSGELLQPTNKLVKNINVSFVNFMSASGDSINSSLATIADKQTILREQRANGVAI